MFWLDPLHLLRVVVLGVAYVSLHELGHYAVGRLLHLRYLGLRLSFTMLLVTWSTESQFSVKKLDQVCLGGLLSLASLLIFAGDPSMSYAIAFIVLGSLVYCVFEIRLLRKDFRFCTDVFAFVENGML